MPMGYLIGNEYADVVGDVDTSTLRDTIYEFLSENASILKVERLTCIWRGSKMLVRRLW